MLRVLETKSTDVYYNQALEKILFDQAKKGEVILYLWRNDNAVVIGKNQDLFAEINVPAFKATSGKAARRISGGGAVYHDLDNLNFTFIAHNSLYDVGRQLYVITTALKSLGIHAAVTGRNDMEINGRKFSGSAFYRSGNFSLHHGTLMLRCSETKMERFLTPDKMKLTLKGISSVRSRVGSLSDEKEVSLEELTAAIRTAFASVYGEEVSELGEKKFFETAKQRAREFSDEDWVKRGGKSFETVVKTHFFWGGFTLKYNREGNRIKEAQIDTDALETDIFPRIERALFAAPATCGGIYETLKTISPQSHAEENIVSDLMSFFYEEEA